MYYAKINPVVSLVPLKRQSKKCLKLKLPEGYEPPSALNDGTTATPLLTVFRFKKIKHGIRIKANYTAPSSTNTAVTLTLTKYYCLYGKFSLGDWLVYRRCKIADLVAFWNDVFGEIVSGSTSLTLVANDLLPSSILDYKKNEIHNALSEDVTFDFNETLFLFIALTFRYANCHECFGDKSCSSASSSCSSSSSSFCSSSSSSHCSSSSHSSSSSSC